MRRRQVTLPLNSFGRARSASVCSRTHCEGLCLLLMVALALRRRSSPLRPTCRYANFTIYRPNGIQSRYTRKLTIGMSHVRKFPPAESQTLLPAQRKIEAAMPHSLSRLFLPISVNRHSSVKYLGAEKTGRKSNKEKYFY